MKRVKAKGVPVVVYKPTLDAPEFFGSEVTHDLEAFKAGYDVIVANRWSDELATWWTRCTRGICLSGTRCYVPRRCLRRLCATSGQAPARAVRTDPIVALDEGCQGLGPGILALPGAGVLPLPRERPVHALDLAVLPGAEGPRVLVPYPAGLEQRVELARPAGRSVVCVSSSRFERNGQ